VWKGPKGANGIQEEIKLMDCSYEQLQKFYKHCMQMLYNTDSKNPGRRVLVDIVQDQIQRCRAELLIRYLRKDREYTPQRCLEDLRGVRAKNKDVLTDENIKFYPIGNVINGLPIEFNEVPFELVMNACLDILGVIDISHLTLNFIVKMGLYFTQQEMQQPVNKIYADNKHGLYEKDPETGKAKNRLEVIKRELKLNPNINLRICNTGLNYNEFRSMYYLKRDKYSNLTTDQLKLLSNKVLYRFQDQCEMQAKQWEEKIREINEVAAAKGWDVTRDIN
jgi:CRISPR/Cas system CSM-associated protein Csm2 small subunit